MPESIGLSLRSISEEYQTYSNDLLKITFTTLADYFYYLKTITFALNPLKKKAMLYLAAAVSDFYVPSANIAIHKIQSSDGPINLRFEMVPKLLRPLVKYWVPDAFVVSFKLETDENILMEKARKALKKYGHKLVIANELRSRKYKVIFVTEDNDEVGFNYLSI